MKYLVFVALLFWVVIGASCKKSTSSGGIASVNVINAVPNISALDVYQTLYDSAFYLYQVPISYESNVDYGLPTGTTPLTLVNGSDMSKPIFQGTLRLQEGTSYSLYLAGQYPSVDTLFAIDNISDYSDSVAGVRFVNLSNGSGPMTVNLVGNSVSQAEFTGLAYKQASSFKTYPDTNGVSSYNFEVHDAKTGSLIYTYTWNFAVFKNNTLVICGSEDSLSTTPISVFAVNNF